MQLYKLYKNLRTLYCFLAEMFAQKESHFYHRLATKMILSPKLSYRETQHFFQTNLKKDYRLYQDFHALIVIDGKVRR